MAYNLQSLITILEQILNPQQTRWVIDHNKPQLEPLFKTVASLQQILENSSLPNIESFESKIRDAAYKAEDMIESYMVDQLLSRPESDTSPFFTPDLQQVTQELDSVIEQVGKLVEGKTMTTSDRSSSGGPATSLFPDTSMKSLVVGVEEDLMQLKGRLAAMQSKLEIIPIVGMGGIGKTTVARNLYNDSFVVSHFDVRAWITISQDYNVREILLGLLSCIIGKEVDRYMEKKNSELKEVVYRSLYGRKYLIVLDDMWSNEAWDDIRRCFVNCNDGSRIMLTTRESDVAKHVNLESEQHQMHLLKEAQSWDLLEKEVFGEEKCPAALEWIGRNIASNCGGLPLAIHVIAGLLSKANREPHIWENIANDVRSAIGGKDEFSNILSLSYNHMPSHLRPCFLYMGAFPEDYEIKGSRLIKLWMAEGFLKVKGDKTLEEVGEDCLKALVGRNLVSVRKLKSNGKPSSYGLHDLMRDLCLKKAEEQRLIRVMNKRVGTMEQESMYGLRRVSVHPSYRIRDIYASTESMSMARSFLCIGPASRAILSSVFFGLGFLRVLDILNVEFQQFPTDVLQIVNLRYLALSCHCMEVPSEISRLWNLQSLLIHSRYWALIMLPKEILQLAELRHVNIYKAQISFYGSSCGRRSINEKLQTISTISSPHDDFLHTIPNIKNLGIDSYNSNFVLDHLHKLETLRFYGDRKKVIISPSQLILPPSLRKLSLSKSKILGDFIKYLTELPDLEVVKLQECELESREWDATEQVFRKLQFLQLDRIELVQWEADQTNFPTLGHLVIRDCPALQSIPSGIGDIPTLQKIELHQCSPSLVASAHLIIEDQHENENYDIQLTIT